MRVSKVVVGGDISCKPRKRNWLLFTLHGRDFVAILPVFLSFMVNGFRDPQKVFVKIHLRRSSIPCMHTRKSPLFNGLFVFLRLSLFHDLFFLFFVPKSKQSHCVRNAINCITASAVDGIR